MMEEAMRMTQKQKFYFATTDDADQTTRPWDMMKNLDNYGFFSVWSVGKAIVQIARWYQM